MGRTSFSGPVYGAKAVLFSGFSAALSTGANGANSTFAMITVPPGEDWYVTDVFAFRKSTGSTGLVCTARMNSSVIATITLNSSLNDASSRAEVAPDGGEKEGTLVPSGAVFSFAAGTSSLASTSSELSMWARGYTRFKDSSRYAF